MHSAPVLLPTFERGILPDGGCSRARSVGRRSQHKVNPVVAVHGRKGGFGVKRGKRGRDAGNLTAPLKFVCADLPLTPRRAILLGVMITGLVIIWLF